jgi:hypothetical protein
MLVLRWIKPPPPGKLDLSDANERRRAEAVKVMAQELLSSFEVVNPLPPYPPAWEQVADVWVHSVWAAAKIASAQYIVSESTHH